MEPDHLAEVDASADLTSLVARYPLPDGVPDTDVNQAELAMALDVTANTVGKWMARSVVADRFALEHDQPNGVPVIQKGGPGQAYVIRLSHAWAWRQHSRALEEGRTARVRQSLEKLQAHMMGLEVEENAVIDPTMRRKMAEAELLWMQLGVRRRSLVALDDLTELLESLLSIMRDGCEAIPDRLERELGLRPEQVQVAQRISADILNSLVERIEAAELREVSDLDDDVPDRVYM